MPEEESVIDKILKLKIAVVILVVAIGFPIYIGVTEITPKYNQMNSLKVSVQEQQTTLTNNKAKLEKLEASLKKQEDDVPPEKEVYVPAEKGLDASDTVAEPFEDVLTMARANTIKLRSIVFDYKPKDRFAENAGDKFTVAGLKMNMIGSYKNFENFLKDLYKHEHFLEITSMTVTPYDKDKSILIIDFDMKLYASK